MVDSLRGLETTKGLSLFVTTIVFMLLCLVIGGLRVWAKMIAKQTWKTHDWLALGALACITGYSVICILCVYPGTIGMHLAAAFALGPNVMRTTLKIFYASGFLWISATTLLKMSLLHFYLGIFLNRNVSTGRSMILRYAAFGVYSIVILYYIAHVSLLLAICRPISLQWNPANPDGHCGDIKKQEISSCAVNIILDLAIVILPMPALLKLQIPTSKKIGLAGLLSLGVTICIINITRLGLIVTHDNSDFTYTSSDVGLLTGMEVWIGYITASLPTLGPLFMQGKMQTQANVQKYYRSRSTGQSSRPSKKSFGASVLETNASFERLNEAEGIALESRDVK
ncbi:hypothetical protein DM02DRAFT_671131 [Periconia macrospinosa]|uniref:Rhodopsin domain-containing protein n=1 Tax=Periconia macrospinosa TaxID=97972 RepID=A0A2V1DU13_9PLEO|nr:hypothetical protein DM02DRAFT_671131 [Periconia macrospinosa]